MLVCTVCVYFNYNRRHTVDMDDGLLNNAQRFISKHFHLSHTLTGLPSDVEK